MDYRRPGATSQARPTAASEAGLFAGVLALVVGVVDAYVALTWRGDADLHAIAVFLLGILTLCLALPGIILAAVGAVRNESPRYVAVAGLVTNTLAASIPILIVLGS